MDFNFSEEQTLLRNMVQTFVQDNYDFDKRMKIVRSESGMSAENWQKFAELGLLAAPFSEEQGGFGGGAVDAMLVMEEFGKGLVMEPYLPTIILCGGMLDRHGTDAQKQAYIPSITDGSAIWALAYSETQSRYQANHVRLSAKADGDGFVLNGHKSVVIAAPWASHLIVSARTSGDENDTQGITLFIVEKQAAGVSCQDFNTVDGGRASDVSFENVKLSADAVIGPVDGGFDVLEEALDFGAAAACAEAVGAMKAATAATIEYARTRKQFGQPIGSFQVLQHCMVDMLGEGEHATSITTMAHLKLDAEASERRQAVSAAKSYIGKSGRMVGQNAVHIHGGMGMTEELNIGHYFKRLTTLNIQFGDEDFHLKRFSTESNKSAQEAA
ncbi:MAG: acyl-CoA dehydrogenase family protein [Parvibaculales bacterium]